jgi:hypothetical protein
MEINVSSDVMLRSRVQMYHLFIPIMDIVGSSETSVYSEYTMSISFHCHSPTKLKSHNDKKMFIFIKVGLRNETCEISEIRERLPRKH